MCIRDSFRLADSAPVFRLPAVRHQFVTGRHETCGTIQAASNYSELDSLFTAHNYCTTVNLAAGARACPETRSRIRIANSYSPGLNCRVSIKRANVKR